jgi:NAD(P)-dependent dehydrogenase (short-subunit alcohol dehydrogenase family)
MAVSLAEKLGSKGLRAFSLHPGVILTNLANHLDLEKDVIGPLRKSKPLCLTL